MKVQLHTVFLEDIYAIDVADEFLPMHQYECEFAGIHFSRYQLPALKYWVRVAARNVYGKGTQVIFLERSPQC